jgi:erythromycin esterase
MQFTIKIFLSVASIFVSLPSFSQQELSKSTAAFEGRILTDNGNDYFVAMKKNEHLGFIVMQNGIDVAIDVTDPSGKKIKTFDSPNGDTGPEEISIDAAVAGKYRLRIYAFIDSGTTDSVRALMMRKNKGFYSINKINILSSAEYEKYLAAEKLKVQNCNNWLSQNAHPLSSTQAGTGFEDLQWLKPVLKDTRFVGLGEATHGTHEFFQMKHRMLEFLVKEMGFTAFAMEASTAGCYNINNYVLYGKGDAHSALASQGFWTWDTEEVIDMIEWIYHYNQTVGPDKKVKFYGFDVQVHSVSGAIDTINNYLHKVDAVYAQQHDSLMKLLVKYDVFDQTFNTDSCRKELNSMLASMAMRKGDYVLMSSSQAYDLAFQFITRIAQLMDMVEMKPDDPRKAEREWRDYYMASNFKDIVAQERPGTKFMIWAHNAHITKNEKDFVNGGVKPFGSYLKESYGDAYYAMGFSFNKGGFQAIDLSLPKKSGAKEFIAAPAKENSLDWFFAQTNKDKFIINFRDNNLPEYIKEWINKERALRDYGAVANRNNYQDSYIPVTLARSFDAIIFIGNTTRARSTVKAVLAK